MAFVDDVKSAAYGRWLDLLTELGGIPPTILDGKKHRCPHPSCPDAGGKDRFRLIRRDEGVVLCNQCFNEKNGDGLAAIQWMTGKPFKEVLELVADRVGVKKRRGGRRKRKLDDDLRWESDDKEFAAAPWLDAKGLTWQTVKAFGGRLAVYKGAVGVVAVPIRTAVDQVVGWIIWNRCAGTIPRKNAEPVKMICVRDSQAGWVGRLEDVEDATTVIKVEGPTDAMALYQDLAGESGVAVLSNAFGASETPKTHLLWPFDDRCAIVVHDPDEPGRKGAERWVEALRPIAARTKRVDLPDGGDLRDWLDSHWPAELLELATDFERVESADPDSASSGWFEESAEDPSRLARLFFSRRSGRIATHAGVVHYYEDGRWQPIDLDEFRSDVLMFVRSEFQRLVAEAIELQDKTDGVIPEPHQINTRLLRSVEAIIMSLSCVSSRIPYGSVIDRTSDTGRVSAGARRNRVAVENGILDLDAILAGQTPFLLEHSPTWFSPIKLPYAFDIEAPIGPHWRSFLELNLGGDMEVIRLLQQWMGYCLIPSTDYQKFLLMVGEGSNGKSVFCAVLEALLGDGNVSHVPLESFAQRFALCPTRGKLANISTEVPELDRVAEAQVKQFADGSPMFIDRKNLNPVDERPTAKLVVATNVLPRIADKSAGMWRRMLLVNFRVQVPEDRRILGMDKPAWWVRQGELPGILNWSLEGLKDLDRRGRFSSSKQSARELEEYRRDVNPAREFLMIHFRHEPGTLYPVTSDDLYKAYKAFCEDNGYRPAGHSTFGKEVRHAFPGVDRKLRVVGQSRVYVYDGLRRAHPDEVDFPDGGDGAAP